MDVESRQSIIVEREWRRTVLEEEDFRAVHLSSSDLFVQCLVAGQWIKPGLSTDLMAGPWNAKEGPHLSLGPAPS